MLGSKIIEAKKQAAEKDSVYRVNVTLTDEQVQMLSDLAAEMGCSRSGIAAYLLKEEVEKIAAIPVRSRKKAIKQMRELLWMSERNSAGSAAGARSDDESEKALRARGVSGAYIESVLDSLLMLVRERYDTVR